MFLTVLLLFFTSALICSAAPTLEKEHCGKPGQKEGAGLQGNWNAETYSPGTVATYTCLNGYIRDGPIKMACIEGSWLDISRGQCKVLGHCSKPQQSHENGELEGQWNDETFPPGKVATYICSQGYVQSSPIKKACIEGEWITSSKGQCIKEIICYQETVSNGIVQYTKETYREGDTVTLTCNEGYRIEHNPDEPRTCTANGWSPPLKCISKKCSQPNPQNARINDLSDYRFPMTPGFYSWLYYYCDSGFLTSNKVYYGKTSCTKTGWNAEPKCYRKCVVPSSDSINAHISQSARLQIYIEGEKLRFQCYKDHKTSKGQTTGEIECLPDGKFSGEKCSKICQTPNLVNGEYKINMNVYEVGAYLVYECNEGYISSDNKVEGISQCGNDGWQPKPECKEIGYTCGAPPVVQFGDITEIKQKTYQSGSSVIYKCANFYKLEGRKVLTCRNGKWEKEPVCRVPCTVQETDMQQNNIQHKWAEDKTKKFYSEHFDNMTFECKPGYQISDPKLLRIQCLDGVLKYPRCLKEGSCVLQQTEMALNNIRYNKGTVIENGHTIEFECEEGMVSENGLKGTCVNKILKYPKCSAGRSCPPPEISNAILLSEKRNSYESGSSVNIKCEDTFVLSGHVNVKCENGQWDELPQCLKPCTITPSSLERNHIELIPTESAPEKLEHGTELNVKCKANFKRPGSLIASCYDGVMKYPKCFSGGTCRIFQQNLDDNFLELDERHENEVFYEEGETVSFKCKTGYRSGSGLTGTCTKLERQPVEYLLTYPTCESESAV